MHLALSKKLECPNIIEILVDYSPVSINELDCNNQTPLQLAVLYSGMSLREVASELDLSYTIVQKITKHDLLLKPYRLQLTHALTAQHKRDRVRGSIVMLELFNNEVILPDLFYSSDEASSEIMECGKWWLYVIIPYFPRIWWCALWLL